MTIRKLTGIAAFLGFAFVFYLAAYYSVTHTHPTSIPVHHDDYTNYSLVAKDIALSWVRPLSTLAIVVLDRIDPDWLTWSIRLLTVVYAWLCWQLLGQLSCVRQRSLTTLIVATCVFSTPVIVEYARYTGMITHLLSGTLGLLATLLLVKGASSARYRYSALSVPVILMSVLAKEDFILLYLYTAAVCAIQFKGSRNANLKVMLAAGVLAVLMIAAEKYLDASSFLGDSNTASSYYLNTSAPSVLNTVYRYLKGADHPALVGHGEVTFSLFVISAVIAAGISIAQRRISVSAYGVGAALAVIGPYSVLPNHVNAYYEFLWTPLIIGTFILALQEVTRLARPPALSAAAAVVLAIATSVLINAVDLPARKSVAHWYDAIAADNQQVLQTLRSHHDQMAAGTTTCIIGASLFSPWYMHGGAYLSNNLDLHSHWVVATAPGSPEHSGLVMGASMSRGRMATVDSDTDFPKDCLVINLNPAQ